MISSLENLTGRPAIDSENSSQNHRSVMDHNEDTLGHPEAAITGSMEHVMVGSAMLVGRLPGRYVRSASYAKTRGEGLTDLLLQIRCIKRFRLWVSFTS